MGAATILLVISGLTPSLKLFLNGRTSSDNVPLTWPYCPAYGLLDMIMGFSTTDMTRDTSTLFEFLCPTIHMYLYMIVLIKKKKNWCNLMAFQLPGDARELTSHYYYYYFLVMN